MHRVFALVTIMAALLLAAGCAEESAEEPEFGSNPFLDDLSNYSKEDTAYINPDGIEVEVDIEADVEAPAYKINDAPAVLGQYALTYLRKRGDFYLESLAEDASSDERVEWRIDGEWLTAAQVSEQSVPREKLTHFRIRSINAVLLHSAVDGAEDGKQYMARVPKKPFGIMADVGDKCADEDDHMHLSQSIYWYMWNPDKNGCDQGHVQDMLLTVSKMLPAQKVTYPEYDMLVEDGKITTVVMFGKIGDGDIETDYGMWGFKRMAESLDEADYTEVENPPVGRRFTKRINNVDYEVDLYSPKDFSGLSDHAHYSNFERAVTEHEIIVYDGHSMMGSSDYWAKPDYPDFYQIFIYGGCLGYEYYVAPVLAGKSGWDKLDIVSSVIEVSVGANDFAGPFMAKLEWALSHNYNVSWNDMLEAIRRRVGDSTFGVCGAQNNCFSPAGSLCGPDAPVEGETKRYESPDVVAIPDNNADGITSVIDVPDEAGAARVTVELRITHSYVGDLLVTLEHDGAEVTLWDKSGGMTANLNETFVLDDFNGKLVTGVWTLKVVDTYAQDTGTLDSWALEVVLAE